jgi:hypothetical protein
MSRAGDVAASARILLEIAPAFLSNARIREEAWTCRHKNAAASLAIPKPACSKGHKRGRTSAAGQARRSRRAAPFGVLVRGDSRCAPCGLMGMLRVAGRRRFVALAASGFPQAMHFH